MDTESNPPIEIHRGRKYVAPLGFILFCIGILATGILAYADLNATTQSNSAELAKQETRLDRLETVYTEIAAIKRDVEWMRRYMEGRYTRSNDEPRELKIPNSR